MSKVYDESRNIKNRPGVKGSTPKARLSFFNSAVTRHGDGVWMVAHDHLKKDIVSALDVYGEAFKDVMMRFFIGIEKRFNLMCAESGTEDEREVELRQHLAANAAEARAFYEGELRPAAVNFFAA